MSKQHCPDGECRQADLRAAVLFAAGKFHEAAAHLRELDMPYSAEVMEKFERETMAKVK